MQDTPVAREEAPLHRASDTTEGIPHLGLNVNSRSRITVLFGAGATKAIGGPITDEILPHVLGVSSCQTCTKRFSARNKSEHAAADGFLRSVFSVPPLGEGRETNDYPSLPLLVTLIDQSILADERLRPDVGVAQLRHIRDSILTVIYDALAENPKEQGGDDIQTRLLSIKTNPLWSTLARICQNVYGVSAQLYRKINSGAINVVTTNYDTYLENTFFAIQACAGKPIRPAHYGCKPDFAEAYTAKDWKRHGSFGTVLKLHGSTAWGYCTSCRRLYDAFTEVGRETIRRLRAQHHRSRIRFEESDASTFRLRGEDNGNGDRTCSCKGTIRLLMLAPSVLKQYHNVHLARVWARAEVALRESDHWYIVGYSLPTDDFEIARLLLRASQWTRRPRKVTVIQKADVDSRDSQELKFRFTRLLGRQVRFYSGGCEDWASRPSD